MAWLSGWSKRIKISVDSGDVDAELTHFPILVYLSASSGINGDDVTSVFDEVGGNYKKIGVTKADGTTQLYVEVEKWDSANEKAWLWVSKSDWVIDDAVDTDIYFYYDNTHADNTDYVGDPESAPAVAVWNANFKMVQHMRDKTTSTTADSTANNNDGTKKAANEPIVTTSGMIGDAQHFDGSDDYVSVAHSASLEIQDAITLEALIKRDANGVFGAVHGSSWAHPWLMRIEEDNCLMFRLRFTDSTGTGEQETDANSILSGNWYYVVATWEKVGGTMRLYINGAEAKYYQNDLWKKQLQISAGQTFYLGATDSTVNFFDGILDEMRISSITPSAAWVNACYETLRDHLLDYGTEEEEGATYTKTWQTDVLFKKLGITKSLGADAAFQKRDIQLTANADVLFKRLGVEKTEDIDVLLKALGIQKTAQVDALFRKLDLLETFGVDTALIKRNIIRSFGVDVRFGALVTKEISRQIDVLFKRLDATKTFGLVVYFGPVEAEAYTKNFALDVIFAYKVRLPELWLDENGKMVLNISKPYTWVGT